jgi:hypothetical protein
VFAATVTFPVSSILNGPEITGVTSWLLLLDFHLSCHFAVTFPAGVAIAPDVTVTVDHWQHQVDCLPLQLQLLYLNLQVTFTSVLALLSYLIHT